MKNILLFIKGLLKIIIGFLLIPPVIVIAFFEMIWDCMLMLGNEDYNFGGEGRFYSTRFWCWIQSL